MDPGLGEIRVQFEQAMDPGSYPVVGGGPRFPRVRVRVSRVLARGKVESTALQNPHGWGCVVDLPAWPYPRRAVG